MIFWFALSVSTAHRFTTFCISIWHVHGVIVDVCYLDDSQELSILKMCLRKYFLILNILFVSFQQIMFTWHEHLLILTLSIHQDVWIRSVCGFYILVFYTY
jgi:hypothetical protein